jgi:hypothetical protein
MGGWPRILPVLSYPITEMSVAYCLLLAVLLCD